MTISLASRPDTKIRLARAAAGMAHKIKLPISVQNMVYSSESRI